MQAALEELDVIWRLGVVVYGLRALEMLLNGFYSVTGLRGIGRAVAGELHRKGTLLGPDAGILSREAWS